MDTSHPSPERCKPDEKRRCSAEDASRYRYHPTMGRRAETPETGLRCGWSPGGINTSPNQPKERRPPNPALQTQGNARPKASPRNKVSSWIDHCVGAPRPWAGALGQAMSPPSSRQRVFPSTRRVHVPRRCRRGFGTPPAHRPSVADGVIGAAVLGRDFLLEGRSHLLKHRDARSRIWTW